MGVIGGAVGITGAGSTAGGAVCVISLATFSCAVSVNSVSSSVTGFKSSGLMSTVLICFGGSGGLLIPR